MSVSPVRLKLGLVSGEYPPMEGGVGAFTVELAKAMSSIGHEIHIITDRQAQIGPEARNWRQLREPVNLGFAWLHARVNRWRWPAVATVVDIALRYELDLLNIQYQAAAYDMRSPAINLLPWRLKGVAKTVVTFHDLRVPYLFPKAGRLRRGAVNFMARQAHGVIVTNAADFQAMQAVGPRELMEIPIGSNIAARPIDANLVESVRAKHGIGRNHFLLGFFGFLHESKGADLLVQALARQDEDIHLLFIGGQISGSGSVADAQFRERLQDQIRALDLTARVHWTGFVSEADVSAYLHAADLMVQPYRDGLSLRRGTLMAVMAHGRPLLTTLPAVPMPELIHERQVYFVPAGEVQPLSEAIERLRSESELRQEMGRQAALLAGVFSWEKIAERSAGFFMQLASGADRPSG